MVRCHYADSYKTLSDRWAGYEDQQRKITFQLGEWVYQMNGIALHLVGVHVIARIIDALKSHSICECGCGSGINLFSWHILTQAESCTDLTCSHSQLITSGPQLVKVKSIYDYLQGAGDYQISL